MRTLSRLLPLPLVLCLLLLATACGSGANAGPAAGPAAGTATGPATATPQPTVAKIKPNAVPPVTLAFCQQVLSIAESNQIMHPANPSTTIHVDSSNDGGSCNYEYSPQGINLIISFQNWNGPVPVSQQDITTAIAQLAGLPGMTVTTFANVSGIGDQAAFVAGQGTKDTLTLKIDNFIVLYGHVYFTCANVYINQAAPPDATQQGKLQQCATQVVSRL